MPWIAAAGCSSPGCIWDRFETIQKLDGPLPAYWLNPKSEIEKAKMRQDAGAGNSQKEIAINEPSHIPKAQCHPSPTLPINQD